MDDYRDRNMDEMFDCIDRLMDELDDIVERLEVYYAGLYSVMYLYPDDLNNI